MSANKDTNKRHRYSSSDTEDSIKPDRKREKTYKMDVNNEQEETDTMVLDSNPEYDPGNVEKLLQQILAGQQDMKMDFNRKFDELTLSLTNMIDSKIGDMKREMAGKLSMFEKNVEDIQQMMTQLESRTQANETELAAMGDLHEQLKNGANRQEQRTTLIVKRLPENESESDEELLRHVRQLIAVLSDQAQVTAAGRLGSAAAYKPRPVAVTMASAGDVEKVLVNKRKLKDDQAYSSVFVEQDRPREIRSLEANVRRLAREHPTLEMRRGRLVEKASPPLNMSAPGDQ